MFSRHAQTPDTMYRLRAVKQCADISYGTTLQHVPSLLHNLTLCALPMTLSSLLDVKTGGAFNLVGTERERRISRDSPNSSALARLSGLCDGITVKTSQTRVKTQYQVKR